VNAELLNMDGLKSEIINSISHEISPPLNRIMGTLHLLKSKIEGDELTEVVNILDQSVFKLEQFSTLAKQISILKSPGYELEKQQVSLKQVIQFSAIENSEELKDMDISLKKQLDSSDTMLNGDSDLLVGCLVSLIRFAKEHTNNNGEILITSATEDGSIVCQVEDGGANYSDTLFNILCDQFSTKNNPLNLTMGIGPAVSQIIMDAHGGHLIFEKTSGEKGIMKMVFPHE